VAADGRLEQRAPRGARPNDRGARDVPRASAVVAAAFLLAGVPALLGAGERSERAEPAESSSRLERATESAPGQDALRVEVEPRTGKLVSPEDDAEPFETSSAENEILSAARVRLPERLVRGGGTLVHLGREHRHLATASVDADGTVHTDCQPLDADAVRGADAATAGGAKR
jgi:hypothetical protein